MQSNPRPRSDPPLLRLLLLPTSISIVFVLRYMVGTSFFVAALASVPFMVVFAIAPWWARQSLASFDRDLVRLLAGKGKDSILARYGRAVGMRCFAPSALVLERRGLVMAELGRHDRAREAYRQAIEESGSLVNATLAVRLGYGHACFELSDDKNAIEAYRAVLATGEALPGVQERLDEALARAAT